MVRDQETTVIRDAAMNGNFGTGGGYFRWTGRAEDLAFRLLASPVCLISNLYRECLAFLFGQNGYNYQGITGDAQF